MPPPVVLAVRMPRLGGERSEQEPLAGRGVLPDEREVRVLGAQNAFEPDAHVQRRRRRAPVGRLPGEVAELLRRVRVARGHLEHASRRPRRRSACRSTANRSAMNGANRSGADHAELHLLRAAPERLVLVVEDRAHHVPLRCRGRRAPPRAAPGRPRASASGGRGSISTTSWNSSSTSATRAPRSAASSPGSVEQPLERRVDVGRRPARLEAERDRRSPRGRSSPSA